MSWDLKVVYWYLAGKWAEKIKWVVNKKRDILYSKNRSKYSTFTFKKHATGAQLLLLRYLVLSNDE
jgi:hypothetical protein